MKFVVGKEGSFVVRDRAFYSKPVRATSGKLIPASISVRDSGKMFPVKRGVAEEWKDVHWGGDGRRVYARVLPEDVEPMLAEVDALIAEAEEVVKKLRADRQAFLAAHVVRGERISIKHIEALPPEPPKEPPPPPDPEKQKRLVAANRAFAEAVEGALLGRGSR